MRLVLLILSLNLGCRFRDSLSVAWAWQQTPFSLKTTEATYGSKRSWRILAKNTKDEDGIKDKDPPLPTEPELSFQERLDKFLDTPFFDPDAVLEDDNARGPLRWLANFVQEDYELAEALELTAHYRGDEDIDFIQQPRRLMIL